MSEFRTMGSTLAFKITASLIKPTRESLLDYCSYILLIIALISIARVIIGSEGLGKDCHELHGNVSSHNLSAANAKTMSDSDNFSEVHQQQNDSSGFRFPSGLQPHRIETVKLDPNSTSSEMTLSKANGTPTAVPPDQNHMKQICVKHYQAYFSYFILVEAIILLFVGILWVKMPKVLSMVNEFSTLFKDCQNTSCLTAAINDMHDSSTTNTVNPLYSIMNNDRVNMEVEILLASLFQENISYHDKAEARRLYERVQKFCLENDSSVILWQSYIQKSIYQLMLWFAFFGLNLVLFVKLEFYIGCNPSFSVCDHDTFLRIAWFMSQLTIIIYGIFNCASLKWINDKSSNKKSDSALLSSVCGCFVYANPIAMHKDKHGFVCLPFLVGKEQKIVHNDVALLFHLVSSSNAKKLPFFTIFLFNQWDEKLKQAGESVLVPRLKNIEYCQNVQHVCEETRRTTRDEAAALLSAELDDTVV